MLQIDLEGLDAVGQRLRTVVTQMAQAAPTAAVREGQQIMETSQALVPVDTGLLRSTGHVALLSAYQAVVVELSYGLGGTAEYAARVEFDTEMNHPRGGQSHFLSEPFFAATDGMLARMAASIRTQMGG